MKQSLIMVYVTSAVLIVIAFFTGGSVLVTEGLIISVNTAYKSALMLAASFIIIGQLNVLLTADILEKWLKKFSGLKAIIISALAGGLFPGGPYIYYPFVLSFREKNLPFYIFISFIFGKQIYDFTRLPMEISLIRADIAFIRFLITLPIPIIVGLSVKHFWGDNAKFNANLKAGGKDDSDNNHS